MTGTQQLTKAKPEGTEAFLSGKLAQVDIARIEKELKTLWQSASGSGDTTSGSVTRACAMNLILYSEDADAEVVAGDVLDDITTRHPCRAILAISRESTTPALEAWVSARCHLMDSKTQKQICCEQITVRSEGNGPEELASVVLPLVLPDLPVFLWWRAKKVQFSNVKPFLPYVDELIVDSSKAEGSDNFFADVIHIIGAYLEEKHGAQIVVSDLNWRRCLLWREALALSFDEKHGRVALSALDQIDRIQIKYAADQQDRKGSINQSLLFVGWLADRLDWRFKSATKLQGGKCDLKFSKGNREIEINLASVDCEASHSGNICGVEVLFRDASSSSVVIQQSAGAPGVQMYKGTGVSQSNDNQYLFKVNQATEARLIDLELETLDRDAILESAFRTAAVVADTISTK